MGLIVVNARQWQRGENDIAAGVESLGHAASEGTLPHQPEAPHRMHNFNADIPY